MITFVLWLLGLVPSFHDWPHRHRDGTCRCRGFCCTTVRRLPALVEEVRWVSDGECFPGEYRPVVVRVVGRQSTVVPACRGNRHGHITWPAPPGVQVARASHVGYTAAATGAGPLVRTWRTAA